MVKNLPRNAEDTGSIRGRGTKIPHAVKQLNLSTTTTEACMPRAPALQQEKPPQEEACIPQPESNPRAATKIQHSPNKKMINKGTFKKKVSNT